MRRAIAVAAAAALGLAWSAGASAQEQKQEKQWDLTGLMAGFSVGMMEAQFDYAIEPLSDSGLQVSGRLGYAANDWLAVGGEITWAGFSHRRYEPDDDNWRSYEQVMQSVTTETLNAWLYGPVWNDEMRVSFRLGVGASQASAEWPEMDWEYDEGGDGPSASAVTAIGGAGLEWLITESTAVLFELSFTWYGTKLEPVVPEKQPDHYSDVADWNTSLAMDSPMWGIGGAVGIVFH